jgi:hypothetical protein
VIAGGGNTEWTPKSMALEKCSRCSGDVVLVAPIKSSTNTSTRLRYVAVACNQRSAEEGVASLSMLSSKGCLGRLTSCRRASITSLAVSDAAQKNGGDSH